MDKLFPGKVLVGMVKCGKQKQEGTFSAFGELSTSANFLLGTEIQYLTNYLVS